MLLCEAAGFAGTARSQNNSTLIFYIACPDYIADTLKHFSHMNSSQSLENHVQRCPFTYVALIVSVGHILAYWEYSGLGEGWPQG